MIEFIQTNFVVLMLLCVLVFVLGFIMWVVGRVMESHYTKKLHRIEHDMDDETWQAWARQQGYRRTVR